MLLFILHFDLPLDSYWIACSLSPVRWHILFRDYLSLLCLFSIPMTHCCLGCRRFLHLLLLSTPTTAFIPYITLDSLPNQIPITAFHIPTRFFGP